MDATLYGFALSPDSLVHVLVGICVRDGLTT